jgi:hypothetical protein
MTFRVPELVKTAERLLVEIEQDVSRFPRAHRYASGAELRAQGMRVARLAHRAWRDRANAADWSRRLVWAVDDLKLTMQLASRIKAFASFGQFESLARIATELGRQVGGLYKHHHPKSQNAAARSADPQRAKTLSTRAASQREAHR